jgi:hypothetical protein
MKTKKTIDDRTPETDDAEWSMDSRDLVPSAKLSEYAELARRLERERNILSNRMKSGQEELLKMLVHFRIKIETINNN